MTPKSPNQVRMAIVEQHNYHKYQVAQIEREKQHRCEFDHITVFVSNCYIHICKRDIQTFQSHREKSIKFNNKSKYEDIKNKCASIK